MNCDQRVLDAGVRVRYGNEVMVLLEELQNSYYYVVDVTETRGLRKQQLYIIIQNVSKTLGNS